MSQLPSPRLSRTDSCLLMISNAYALSVKTGINSRTRIQANGQIHPIVVKDGILIGGRNRRTACEIAGITPEEGKPWISTFPATEVE